MLQVQHLLQGLQQEHVRRDLLAGNNQAPHLPAQRLHSLNQLATLLGAERDSRLRYCSATTADEWQMQSKLAVMGKKQHISCAQPKNQNNISPRHQSSKLWCWSLIKKKNAQRGIVELAGLPAFGPILVFSSFSLFTCQHWQSWNVLVALNSPYEMLCFKKKHQKFVVIGN